jgi:hypothetical protein
VSYHLRHLSHVFGVSLLAPSVAIASALTLCIACAHGDGAHSHGDGGPGGGNRIGDGGDNGSDAPGGGVGSTDGAAVPYPSPDAAKGADGAGGGAGDGGALGSEAAAESGVLTGDGASCPANTQYPQTTFVNLAPPMGAALDRTTSDPIPGDAGVPPTGWNFYQPSGALCRDGSPAGFYVRYTSSAKLLIYLEGGGACDSQHFCDHNPQNLNEIFPGGADSQGQTITGSLVVTTGLQQPYDTGIFDFTNSANPFNGWNQVYIPYCTGDVHFGTVANAMVDQVTTPQQFVGYLNMQKFIGRLVPTFPNLDQVVLTGASAGGFGAGLNYGMVQDAFGHVPVTVLDDSGPPFSLMYLPACLQQQWRTLWGFSTSLPSDCAECTAPDGSGLTNIVHYWRQKYANARVGLVSSMDDQVMELFFAQGINNCATNDPNLLVIGDVLSGVTTGATVYPDSMFEAGLTDLRDTFACTGALATYYIAGSNHQHIFRSEFFQTLAGNQTLAAWTTDLISGNLTQVGP